jgi:hypothetical protein
VSFAHVNGQKIGVVFVIVEDLDDVADLATKGRSGKAAEDQDERLAAGALADVEGVGAVQCEELSVGSGVADVQVAATHVGQGIANHVHGVFGAAGHDGEADEGNEEQSAESDRDPHVELFQE